jgi:hypothetical protein
MEELARVADILAIPFFLAATLYFLSIRNKTPVEYVLLLFVAAGFVLDTVFTAQYLTRNNHLLCYY